VTTLTILAALLLVGGVVGCLLPRVPGVSASLAGVYLYWWTTGFTEPSTALVVVISLIGGLAAISPLLAEMVSSRVGDASRVTLLLAGAVGSAFLVLTGPLGMFVATTVTVFVLEYRRQRDVSAGAKAALAIVASSVGSRIFRLSLAVIILLVMVVTVVL
jgi:uncharacterized protein YqgC (DUF456 family)